MRKTLARTIAIIMIIIVSVALGYAYDRITVNLEKKSHPIPDAYKEIVEKYAEEYDVPKEIIYSVINTESSFNSAAVSDSGAIGLMQIMPETFEWIAMKIGENPSDGLIYDPHTNIRYGTFLLKYLYREFENWDIAFAAYNAGINRVKNNWLNNPEYIKDNEIVYIPIDETRNYVKKVNNNIEVYKRLYFNKNN